MFSKPQVTNLITALASRRNGILNQSIWNHLVSTSEVIGLRGPYHPLTGSDSATTNPLFVSMPSFLPLPSAGKNLPFCTAPHSSFLSVKRDIA